MSVVSVTRHPDQSWIKYITSRAYLDVPAIQDWLGAFATSALLILSFPNFELALLAWVGLIPLLLSIARQPSPLRALILGWTVGTIFFYGTCHWLTYSMIHYGGLSAFIAYLLLIPGAIILGFFLGIFALWVAVTIRRWGPIALLLSPFIWVAMEYARLGVTGQLWNALGYSQAYYPALIQTASFGGVYAVSFLIVATNVVITLLLIDRRPRVVVAAASLFAVLTGITFFGSRFTQPIGSAEDSLSVVALQPNVPMTLIKSNEEMQELFDRHLEMSKKALASAETNGAKRLLIWPESPMNFTFTSDRKFQEVVTSFAIENRTSILFNSQEPAPDGGTYNSAILINEEGRAIAQYDKIRLLPFGEYVPVPRWVPGASLITAIVGDFTPGTNYTLMPVGDNKHAGVFICVESAYPSIARTMTKQGADILINISNDGYLGPTAVMRQHLGNAVFRAVENGRTVVRVTNSGITALIKSDGRVNEPTSGFISDVRIWRVGKSQTETTFYSQQGDLFALFCLGVTTFLVLSAFIVRKRRYSSLR